MLKALIVVDLEGCVGVTKKVKYGCSVSAEMPSLLNDYRRTCTLEVIACVEGLRIAGFSEVHVHEGHAGIVISQLLPGAVMFSRAVDKPPYFEISRLHWDGVVLLGAHAATGTPNATLCHTLSSINPQIWRINGIEAGEIGIQSTMLSVEKSPILMVTGGMCLANEVAYWCPSAIHVAVKRDEGMNQAISLPRDEAVRRIRETASSLRPLDFQELPVMPPYSIEIHFLGGSPKRFLFRTAWLLKRILLKKPKDGTFRILRGSLEVKGDDPRVLVNDILGRPFLATVVDPLS